MALGLASGPQGPPPGGFVEKQLRYPRYRAAEPRAEPALRAAFTAADAPYPPKAILLRALKRERTLELWAAREDGAYVRVKAYPVCAASGDLGPKSRQGDEQVPEGFYSVDRFNPSSNFHLSLGIDYPNAADRKRSAARNLGGDIFIHGSCVSIGCLSIRDGPIEEVYVAAVAARNRGQRSIPVHVFPARLDVEGLERVLSETTDPARRAFWTNLSVCYQWFERTKVPPNVHVSPEGEYVFRD